MDPSAAGSERGYIVPPLDAAVSLMAYTSMDYTNATFRAQIADLAGQVVMRNSTSVQEHIRRVGEMMILIGNGLVASNPCPPVGGHL